MINKQELLEYSKAVNIRSDIRTKFALWNHIYLEAAKLEPGYFMGMNLKMIRLNAIELIGSNLLNYQTLFILPGIMLRFLQRAKLKYHLLKDERDKNYHPF